MRDYTTGLLLALSCLTCSPPCISAEIPTDYSQQTKPATIKILIADKADGAILEVKGRYDIFNPHTQLPITSSILGKRAAIYAHGEGVKWDDPFPYINQMRIVPSNPESSILINGIEYRGCIEIYNLNGVISIVNEVDIENFLKSTLSVQLTHVSDPKVLEALAIVARTNAYYLASRNFQAQWHIRANETDYMGYGVTLQHLAIDRAIENTRHMVMTYKSQPFAASWTENSAGRTANYCSIFRKQVVAPQGVPTPIASKDREKHHWVAAFSKQEIAELAGLTKIVHVSPYLDQNSEKTYAVRISDGALTQDVDFFTLQKKLGKDRLRSNDFEVTIKGDKVLFSGWGQGHGVGLCLYSAKWMAAKGDSVAKILSQFFPSTQLQNMRSFGQKNSNQAHE
ncbi:MAG: SpoIID/LytB domain-containing protein [Simkania sp.]|nr:SpoIID/LytB domain-containing protein [Simkania sp.]